MHQQFDKECFNYALNQSISFFLESVISLCELNPYKDSKLRKHSPRFDSLKPNNSEYDKMRYYEEQIDKRIRTELLLPFLHTVFEEMKVNCYWPEDSSDHLQLGYSDSYPFEFIISDGRSSVGYSFHDHFSTVNTPLLLEAWAVNHFEVIVWNDNRSIVQSFNQHQCDELKGKVRFITFQEFFCLFFSEETYSLFTEKIKDAIHTANRIVGFQTIPQLTLSNLSELKKKSATDIKSIDYQSLKMSPLSNSKTNKEIIFHFKQFEYQTMLNNFIDNKYYLALLGKQEFARCFITSEYLYSIFKMDYPFDYTSVAAGYFKTVEQLIYHLVRLTLDDNPQDLWIKKNRKTQGLSRSDIRDNPHFKNDKHPPKQVRFKKDLDKYFDISLGSLCNFLCDNKDAWTISSSSVETTRKILSYYSQNCRNEHFHKENIFSPNDIEVIRNNTLLVCFLVLGAYCVPQKETTLGIIDSSFENLYRRLKEIPKSQDQFWISFDGETYFNTIRLIDQPHPIYDSTGSLQESQIEFIIVDSFDTFSREEFYKTLPNKEKLIINSNNIPKEIWLYKRFKKEMLKIEW